MIEIIGKYNTAVCYTDILESSAYGQILSVCNEQAFADSKIRIMPDVHAGLGCTIGTTMTITDKVVPSMVGVDIGCGMETVVIKEKDIDFKKLDELIRSRIPCGRQVHTRTHSYAKEINLKELRCVPAVDLPYALRSIGTLGGGNHFIELDKDTDGNIYLVVHSGSRHLGCEVARIYQEQGRRAMWGGAHHQVIETIEKLRAQGREKEIESTVKELRREHRINIPRELAYVEGRLFEDYIYDMKIVQYFATLNRKAIADTILEGMGFTEVERFTTIHNYIDTESMTLRKGAVSAKKGEKLLIPINMRDGSLICIGKGNEDWNCSAPHGAGRLMSRSTAMESLSVEEFRSEMSGIYTTCVSADTLDESPMAYKSMENIVCHITPTAEIVSRITPVYNFKSAE